MQISLLLANAVVLLFGLSVVAVGTWAMTTENEYLLIANRPVDPELTRLPLSMIVAGVFVAVLALLGMVGGVFVKTMSGRTLLGVYSFVLCLLIVSEVGAGAAAISFQSRIEDTFEKSANVSILNYGTNENISKVWDTFQQDHHCCGSASYKSYRMVFYNNTLPESCCNFTRIDKTQCETLRINVTSNENNGIFSQGCPAAAVGFLKNNLVAMAMAVIVIGVAQLVGVVLTCLAVAYFSSLSARPFAYKKLEMVGNTETL